MGGQILFVGEATYASKHFGINSHVLPSFQICNYSFLF